MYIRKSVWANGGDFNDPTLLWYARGVGELQKLPPNDTTSWAFLAGIHGYSQVLWSRFGYNYSPSQLPDKQTQDTYWNQCQHGSWYFVPWHRGYLLSLEAIVRDAIIKLGGPADWALPYWNYSDTTNPNALDLPTAFSDLNLPDGSPNPLYVEFRLGASQGSLPLPTSDVSLNNLKDQYFTGSSTASRFGGVETGFSHSGRGFGGLESLPHNPVHTDIGGGKNGPGGVMSYPASAGLDPIFYIHHANIDRLWQAWLNSTEPVHENPTDESAWMTGPADRHFIVPMIPNGQGWTYAAENVLSTTSLNNVLGNDLSYEYDDAKYPFGSSTVQARLENLGVSPKTNLSFSAEEPMSGEDHSELVGANSEKIKVVGVAASTDVQLDKEMLQKTNVSFSAAVDPESTVEEPDHVYLNIENIRSNEDARIIDVYINLPEGENASDHPELYVGPISFFGVTEASLPDSSHGGAGVNQIFNITSIVDDLYLAGGLENLSSIKVNLVPRGNITSEDNITIDRISVYREGK